MFYATLWLMHLCGLSVEDFLIAHIAFCTVKPAGLDAKVPKADFSTTKTPTHNNMPSEPLPESTVTASSTKTNDRTPKCTIANAGN